MISRFFFIFFLGLALSSFTQTFIVYNKPSKLYGLKDKKTQAWIGKPEYTEIDEVKVSSFKGKYFLVTKNNKQALLASNGSKTIIPFYDQVEQSGLSADHFYLKDKDKEAIYRIGKGILSRPGWYDKSELVTTTRIYKLRKNQKVLLFDFSNDSCSVEFDDVIGAVQAEDPEPPMYGAIMYLPAFYGSNFIVKKNSKLGISDFSGKMKLDPVYDELPEIEIPAAIYTVKKDGKWGLMDEAYKIVISCSYENIDLSFARKTFDTLGSTLYPVKLNGKWGVINQDNKWTIPAENDSILRLEESGLVVAIRDNKMGLIDLKNRILYPFKYNYIKRESVNDITDKNKNYLVNSGCTNCEDPFFETKWGMADSLGNLLLNPIANYMPLVRAYRYATDSLYTKYDGYDDSVKIGYLWNIGGTKKMFVKSVDSVYMENFDPSGNEIMQYQIQEMKVTFITGGKTGIVSRNGKIIIPPYYEDMKIWFRDPNKEATRVASISEPRDILNGNDYEYRIDMNHPIMAKRDGKWGLLSWKGKELTEFCSDSIESTYADCWIDISDSAYIARGYQKTIYKFFQNGKYGYFNSNGKTLIPAELQNEVVSLSFISFDSLNSPTYYKETSQLPAFLVARSGNGKMIDVLDSVEVEEVDNSGNFYFNKRAINNPHLYFEKGSFAIQNACEVKMLTDEWYEDYFFTSRYSGLRFSDLRSQLKLGRKGGTLVQEREGGKKFDFSASVPEDLFPLYDYIFVKQNGQWFLKNIFCIGLINQTKGFDSVEAWTEKKYKAYRNGKYGYFDYNFKGPFDCELEKEFPEETGIYRLAYRNGTYRAKTYLSEREEWIIDHYGNETSAQVTHTLTIPFVVGGEYNILNDSDQLLLKDWANEVLFPLHPDSTFSISDTTSSIYKTQTWTTSNWPQLKSVALKYGDKWKLCSFPKMGVVIPVESVKLKGDKWEVIQNGKTEFYSASTLERLSLPR
jgi:hypothetical protein